MRGQTWFFRLPGLSEAGDLRLVLKACPAAARRRGWQPSSPLHLPRPPRPSHHHAGCPMPAALRGFQRRTLSGRFCHLCLKRAAREWVRCCDGWPQHPRHPRWVPPSGRTRLLASVPCHTRRQTACRLRKGGKKRVQGSSRHTGSRAGKTETRGQGWELPIQKCNGRHSHLEKANTAALSSWG